MLMTILSKLLLVAIVVGLIALYHGWVDAHYNVEDRYIENTDRKMGAIIIGFGFSIVSLIQGLKIGLIVLGLLIALVLVGYVLLKFAAFFRNYSFRKFSEKE